MELVNRDSYKKFWMLFYIFLVVYAGLMLYLCYELNIWMDEAYTLDTTSSKYSFTGVLHQSYYFESQPPVYFVLLWLWRKINDSVFFAHLFSLISIGVAAWYFFKSARLISGTETTKWLTILFLMNPFTVFAALEIRLYAFLLCLSTMAIYYYMKYYTGGVKKNLYIFLAISLVGLYTQYFFAFLIAGFVFSTFVFKGWKPALTLTLYVIPVVIIFSPNVFFMGEQLGMVQTHKLQLSYLDRLSTVLHSPQNLMLSLETLWVSRWLRVSLLLVAFGLFAYSYAKAYDQHKNPISNYFPFINFSILTTAAIVVVLALFITITGIDHVDRYLAMAVPMFVLSFALIGIHGIFYGRIMFACFVLYYGLLFVYHYSNPVKQFDYKQVAAYVEKNARPGEPVMFYQSTVALPFRYYYNGKNPIAPLPYETKMDTTYMDNIKDTAELKQAIENIKTTSATYLLITDLNLPKYKDDPNRTMINNYLQSHYNITSDTLYFGDSKILSLRIRRLEKK